MSVKSSSFWFVLSVSSTTCARLCSVFLSPRAPASSGVLRRVRVRTRVTRPLIECTTRVPCGAEEAHGSGDQATKPARSDREVRLIGHVLGGQSMAHGDDEVAALTD